MEIDQLLTEFEKATIDVTYGIGGHNRAWEQQDIRKKILDFANREDDKLEKARKTIEAVYPEIAKDESGIANHAFECLVEHRAALDTLMDMLAKITQSEQMIVQNAANIQELVTLRKRIKAFEAMLSTMPDADRFLTTLANGIRDEEVQKCFDDIDRVGFELSAKEKLSGKEFVAKMETTIKEKLGKLFDAGVKAVGGYMP